MSEPIELQLKYRPKLFKEVIGQAEACRVLLQMTPSSLIILVSCGKTNETTMKAMMLATATTNAG